MGVLMYSSKDRSVVCDGKELSFNCGEELTQEAIILLKLVFNKASLQETYTELLELKLDQTKVYQLMQKDDTKLLHCKVEKVLANSNHSLAGYVEDDEDIFIIMEDGSWYPAKDIFYIHNIEALIVTEEY